MIDVHCHLLPGIDDGAKTIDIALELAKEAVQQGVTHIVCTPHHLNRSWMNPRAQVELLVHEFQKRLQREKIDLTLFPGQEIRIAGDIPERIDRGDICFYDVSENYLLIEFPTQTVPEYTDQLFYQLQARGITPVIAHPERNYAIQKDPEILKGFVEKGVLGQLTAASLLGDLGKDVRRFSLDLIEARLVHTLGSDAHDPQKRPFVLGAAYKQLNKDFGKEAVQSFDQVARNLVNGDAMYILHPASARPMDKKKKLFGFL
ncbi:tyrosine protein phosphatase [Atopobacter sp. AH10]|uniref:tyrosine-protein phosphatase n=1 Tax=Atopobacter sp. AH10 TaxID=2315861 RepID=UPI000EF1FC5E|nr:CpsB/CapC family capsule biosynthesis tyrosine phosphatase [Atopobacter sp. AH10]RLK63782.1 tyrosine protein phosphatase [Atopobacter sp. AH10]